MMNELTVPETDDVESCAQGDHLRKPFSARDRVAKIVALAARLD